MNDECIFVVRVVAVGAPIHRARDDGRVALAVDIRFPATEELQDFAEHRPAALRRSDLLLVPAGDTEMLPGREGGDRLPLGEERNALALAQGGDPEVGEVATFGGVMG